MQERVLIARPRAHFGVAYHGQENRTTAFGCGSQTHEQERQRSEHKFHMRRINGAREPLTIQDNAGRASRE